MKISPSEILEGRRLFLMGGTGFLGKVSLSMLLDRFPQIGRIYVMVRPSAGAGSEERFWDSVLPSPAFDPLRQRYGEGLKAFLREKLVIVGGDVTKENLGYSEEEAERIASGIDVLVNCSGRVSFNPPLEAALKTNVNGTLNTLAFARRMKRPALIHVSTCFVAGNRTGEIWENEPVAGYFPRRGELKVPGFSVEQEIRDCERLAARVRDEAEDHSLAERFREAARRRFIEEGRDPDDEKALRLAIASERKNWIRTRLTELGIEKANWWGWPNIYTYTKSLGEQLVAAATDVVRSIIRPAIVESAEEFPFPGWNEGFNTTAPLIHLALKGQNLFPVREDVILDVIPVDSVAATVIAVTAQASVEEPALVHQLSSGDLNPARLGRLVTLVGLYKRKHFQEKETGNRFLNEIAARMEAETVSPKGFERYSLPALHRATRAVADFLDRVPPHRFGPLSGMAQQVRGAVADLEAFTKKGEEDYHTFKPFIVDNAYVFRADNSRALFARLADKDRKLLRWSPQSIDWYDYWLRVHLPGLEKWVFPKLEEGDKPKRRVYTYGSLVELFDGVTKVHAGRVAMRMERGGREERYTYADLRECALRAAAFLAGQGIGPGDRVGLLSENCPDWGMSYFGITKTGATCIPIEKESSTEEVLNLARLGEASGIIVSDDLAKKHVELAKRLKKEGMAVGIWRFHEVFALGDEALERERIAALPSSVRSDALASIIFTSGTTGNPKGVMLTHRNFTSQVAKLLSVYDLESRDGMLSVLPLHHSFEFSTGFLLPLSRGAQITYIPELTGEVISRALKKGHVTCIVGVPALWESLKRRIMGKFSDQAAWLEDLATALIDANHLLRDETPFNFGPLLFFPIHLAFGGKIRYLISGGSALSPETLKTFRGLGFNLNEGYGLTEAAPVLTVTRPGERVIEGSVGKPLPGIEIKILNPDRRGMGEVLARGPNVMAGYYGNDDATRGTLKDGWLHTGDLGRLDEEGNLYLVGRLKEVIVDANGKNVYPEELEELYAEPDLIKEMSIVGLPEGAAERVAALAVANYEHDRSLSRTEVRAKIEEHFQRVSATLPLYKRVKTLQIWDGELPRTATRKVKRREAVSILQRLKRQAESAAAGAREAGEEADLGWLLGVVATIAEKPRSAVHLDSRLDDLGFDSLMYNELAAAIEAAGVEPPSPEALAGVSDLHELAEHLKRAGLRREEPAVGRAHRAAEGAGEIQIPPAIAEWGKRGLSVVQRWFYHDVLHPEFRGRGHIPSHTHFIVAANHASHLDMGLAKMALGDAGKNLVALAAADYFFNTKLKRAVFENFTNLVPMERKGSLRRSLRWAFHLLEQGYNVLIFPEGTRSRTGRMQRFQRGLGYLALRARVGVLPMYLSTHHALPPGSWYPKAREVRATIGPFLSYEMLARLTEGMPRAEAERWVTALVQKVVEDLRDGIEPEVREEALRRRLTGEASAPEWVPVEKES